MKVAVNGGALEVADGETVAGLLRRLGLDERPVAVERNGVIIPRADHPSTVLAEGDALEVLHFVGGGRGAGRPKRGRRRPSRAEASAPDRLRLLEALHDTAQAFQAATTVEEILRAVLDGVRSVSPFTRGYCLLAEEGRLRVRAAAEGPPPETSFDIGDVDSLSARVFREAAPATAGGKSERGAGILTGTGWAYPLAGGRIHGVLLLEAGAAARADEPPDWPASFADAAGLALDTAVLYRDLVEALHHISILSEASRRMQEGEGEPESLSTRALAPAGLALRLSTLTLYAADGDRLGGLGGPAELPRSALGRLAALEGPVVEEADVAWGFPPGRVIAAVPIRRPPFAGTLVAAVDRRDDLPPARLDLLAAVGDRLGLAMRDSRLVTELRAHSVAVEYLNRELARTVDSLRRANELKSRFVSTVSHELRTPLASIRLHAETILDALGDLDREKIRDFVTVIAQEAERLSRLIGGVLDLARLVAGRRPLLRTAVDLGETVERVAGTLRPIADAAGVSMEVRAEGNLVVQADRDSVIQALTNVVANAVKYSRSGGRVRIEARTDGQDVSVAVIDTGAGISPEHLPHVFEEFYKVDATGSEEGTGLGLAITKAIVEGHGGGIEVESEPGRGSTFTLRFSRGA